MNVTRLVSIAMGLLAVGVLALGWFLGISPILAQAAAADAQRTSVELQNAQLAADLVSLKADFETIDDARAELEVLGKAVPAHAATAELSAQISGAASSAGAAVTSLTFNNPSLYTPEAADAATSTTGTLAGTAPSGALLTRLYTMTISGTVLGNTDQVTQFLAALQGLPRLVVVTDVRISGPAEARTMDFSAAALILAEASTAADVPAAPPAGG